MLLSFTSSDLQSNSLDLVRLGHLLGNNHYPIKIQDNQIHVSLVTNPKILEQQIKQLKIQNLKVSYTNQVMEFESHEFIHHH